MVNRVAASARPGVWLSTRSSIRPKRCEAPNTPRRHVPRTPRPGDVRFAEPLQVRCTSESRRLGRLLRICCSRWLVMRPFATALSSRAFTADVIAA